MRWFDGSEQEYAHHMVRNARRGDISHEVLASAAAFAAAKTYEDYRADHGTPVSHATTKAILAAGAGFYIDHVAESKDVKSVDRRWIMRAVSQQTDQIMEDEYGY